MSEVLKSGPITVIIEESKIAERIFKQKDRNFITRMAMLATMDFWARVFLPQRFDDSNAKYNIAVSGQWDAAKVRMLKSGTGTKDGRHPIAPQPRDLLFTGIMRTAVLTRFRTSATATGGRPIGRVAMPTGHPIKPNLSRVFRRLPDFEIKRLTQVFKDAFSAGIKTGEGKQQVAAKAKVDARQARLAARRSARESARVSGSGIGEKIRKPRASLRNKKG